MGNVGSVRTVKLCFIRKFLQVTRADISHMNKTFMENAGNIQECKVLGLHPNKVVFTNWASRVRILR